MDYQGITKAEIQTIISANTKRKFCLAIRPGYLDIFGPEPDNKSFIHCQPGFGQNVCWLCYQGPKKAIHIDAWRSTSNDPYKIKVMIGKAIRGLANFRKHRESNYQKKFALSTANLRSQKNGVNNDGLF